MDYLLISILYYLLLCRCEFKKFYVHFGRLRFVDFSSTYGKYAVYDGKNGWKRVSFSSESAVFFVLNMIKVLFPIRTSTWRVNSYVFGPGKSTNESNESTIKNISFCSEKDFIITLKDSDWSYFFVICRIQIFNLKLRS